MDETEQIKEQVRIHEAALELERSKLETLTHARDIMKYGKSLNPLCQAMRDTELPPGRSAPSSKEPYEGITCPIDHRIRFEASLGSMGVPDNVKAQLFPNTLYGPAMTWWKHLRPNPITSWDQMIAKFTLRFENFLETARPVSYLAEIVQKEHESLRSFVKRFEQAVVLVESHPIKDRVFHMGENTNNASFRYTIVDAGITTERELNEVIKKCLSTHETLDKMVVRAEVKKAKPVPDNTRLGN